MSKLLLVLAVLCFAVAAQADSTTISLSYFSGGSNTCQGANLTIATYTAGACNSNGGQYSSYYCDANNVYQLTFSDASCNATFVQTIAQIPTSCAYFAPNMQYVCNNPSAGPALPSVWSFPPTNWAQSTYCYNTTTTGTSYAASCASGTEIKCIKSAAPPVGCQKTKLANNPSVLSGCVGSDIGTVYYSDDSCAGTVVGAVITPAGCSDGTTASCSAANVLPTSLPTIGYKRYSDDKCTSAKPSASVFFYDSQCFSSQSYTCTTMVNGTMTPTLTTYATVSNGTCVGTATVQQQAVDVCTKGKIFSCTSAPTPTGAAASTGASMVAMVLASIVALIASLSL